MCHDTYSGPCIRLAVSTLPGLLLAMQIPVSFLGRNQWLDLGSGPVAQREEAWLWSKLGSTIAAPIPPSLPWFLLLSEPPTHRHHGVSPFQAPLTWPDPLFQWPSNDNPAPSIPAASISCRILFPPSRERAFNVSQMTGQVRHREFLKKTLKFKWTGKAEQHMKL